MTVGVIGGTAFEDPHALLSDARLATTTVDEKIVPYFEGTLVGTDIDAVYVRRHGEHHAFPPHLVPYTAHALLMKQLRVDTVWGTAICGSLRENLPPGTAVVPDQVVDLTGRPAPEGLRSSWVHLPFGEPYCPALRTAAAVTRAADGTPPAATGSVVTIAGPRFASRAEAQWLAAQGWDLVNMTQATEAYAFRQVGLCYSAIAFVTDYAYGLDFAQDDAIDGSMVKTLDVFRRIVETGPEHLIRVCQTARHGAADACRCRRPMPAEYYKGA